MSLPNREVINELILLPTTPELREVELAIARAAKRAFSESDRRPFRLIPPTPSKDHTRPMFVSHIDGRRWQYEALRRVA